MKSYLISIAAGLLDGVIYNLINARSPSPPLIALIRFLGIIAGEQIVPVGKQFLAGTPLHVGLARRNEHIPCLRRASGTPCKATS